VILAKLDVLNSETCSFQAWFQCAGLKSAICGIWVRSIQCFYLDKDLRKSGTEVEFQEELKADANALKENEEKEKNEHLRREVSAKRIVVQRFKDDGPLNTNGIGTTKFEGFHTAKAPGKTRAINEKDGQKQKDKSQRVNKKEGRYEKLAKKTKFSKKKKKNSWSFEDILEDEKSNDWRRLSTLNTPLQTDLFVGMTAGRKAGETVTLCWRVLSFILSQYGLSVCSGYTCVVCYGFLYCL